MKKLKKLLFSITKKDFRIDYYKGKGKGGQKKNKTTNCCRITHIESGATGKAEDTRSKEQNKKLAFQRLIRSEKFKKWLDLEAKKESGLLALIEAEVDREMQNIKIEGKNEQGRWTEI